MKKIVLGILLVLPFAGLKAQPWMPKKANGPVNFWEIMREHEMNEEEEARERGRSEKRKEKKNSKEQEGEEEEDDDYQFQRWAWYWSQHLDENGNMVSPAKTLQEWQKFQASAPAAGTKSKTTAGATSNWVFQGPDTTVGGYAGLGRINVLAFHPTDPKTIYAGSSGGGLWKTIDSARTWWPLYSSFATLGVSDIVVNPVNPNTVYLATGDADGWGNYSLGLLKSYDAGATWNPTSIAWTPFTYNWIRSVVINPRDTNRLFMATRGGLYATNNGFATSSVSMSGDFSQVMYHPTDTNIIYAARYPVSPDSSSQLFRSTNAGATWTQVTHFTDAQRIAMAVCPSSPGIVKLIVSNPKSGLQGIYNSTNAGATFTNLYYNDTNCRNNLLGWDLRMPSTGCGGQGWYDLCIAIDPNDQSKVTIGGVNTHYSADGGSTWTLATQWYGGRSDVATVHADKHIIKYNPLNHVFYQGHDGGVYSTTDPGSTYWQNITNGMGITQFYRSSLADDVPWCIAGAQDNGTIMVNNGSYPNLTGGDGMQPRVDYSDPLNTWYTSSQNGWINRTTDGGAHYTGITSAIPDTLNGLWITPYILHPRDPFTLLVGIDILFTSPDQGGSFTAISPQFTPLSKINNIAMSPADSQTIYLQIEDRWNYHNTLHYTTNYGATWDTIPTSMYPNSISRLEVDPHDAHILWVTFGGYGTYKAANYDIRTGRWTNRSGGLPNIPTNCIIIDSFSGTKYVGTDVAVYYMDTTMTSWALYSTNLPSAQITDLNINYKTGYIWAATYGRGMWKTMKRENPTGIHDVVYAADLMKVMPNPSKGEFTLRTTAPQLVGKEVSVRLISATGVAVLDQKLQFDNSGSLKVSAGWLAPGVYFWETGNGGAVARCRIVISQ